MSHFSVVVCTDDPERLDEIMAPFDENREVAAYEDYETGAPSAYWAVRHLREENGLNPDDATLTWAQVADAYNARYGDDGDERIYATGDGQRAYTISTRNPDAKWDYWRIGGRWGGYFPYQPANARLVMRPAGGGWDSPDIKPLHCDGGPKSALDLAALREEKAEEARKLHAEFRALTDGTPEGRPWAEYIADVEAKRLSIDEARTLYHAQPCYLAIAQSDFRYHDDAIGTFSQPEALYVEKERARAVPGYATITLDGRWMSQGRMGWFGMSTDTENDRIGYWEAANAYIEALADSVHLIALDCHI
jgi:hypothetical protein